MSAAEKLGALVVGFFEDTEPAGHEAPEEVIAALPQIVAVMEAAERMTRADFRSGQVYPTKTDQDMLDAALAALDEALS
jgi:hypothetical protein